MRGLTRWRFTPSATAVYRVGPVASGMPPGVVDVLMPLALFDRRPWDEEPGIAVVRSEPGPPVTTAGPRDVDIVGAGAAGGAISEVEA